MLKLLFILLIPNVHAYDVQLQIPNILKSAEIKYEIPTGLLNAIALVESSGNHKVFVKKDGKGSKSSYGLLQIQLASARLVKFEGKPKDLMIPEVNIEYGARYLKWILKTHQNNVSWSLTCWNAGPYSNACKTKTYGKYVGSVFNALLKEKNE